MGRGNPSCNPRPRPECERYLLAIVRTRIRPDGQARWRNQWVRAGKIEAQRVKIWLLHSKSFWVNLKDLERIAR